MKHNKPHKKNKENRRDLPRKNTTKQKTGEKHVGTLRVGRRGTGTVVDKDTNETYTILQSALNHALSGDVVSFYFKKGSRTDQPLGMIDKVLVRSKIGYGGILYQEGKNFYVKPSDPRMYVPIKIKDPKNARIGEKVFSHIKSWELHEKYPIGDIAVVLGEPFTQDAEMRAFALEKGFDPTFKDAIIAESKKIEKESKADMEAEYPRRRDFRNDALFTIDPNDAKDFDDALSVKDLGDGLFEIGVHIADVSHYVKKGSALDDEAFKRATSVYLVDRTIPMLPEVLSNDLCSLKPEVERLSISAVFIMNKSGDISKRWFGKTVINSKKRFTYEEAFEVIHGTGGPFKTELTILNEIAKNLKKNRVKKGALNFEQDEVKFVLGENGEPIDVKRKVRNDAHFLVEELMLLANKEVANYMENTTSSPLFLYRVHDTPDEDKLSDLAFFLKHMGYNDLLSKQKITARTLQTLLKKVANLPEKNLIETTIIRSMAKAIYTTKNIGHFGLAFDSYTHFTSPIRRYPDVIVHRLLLETIENRIKNHEIREFEHIANYTSERERNAAEAERNSLKYTAVWYMSKRIGSTFLGTVTGINEHGLFVEENLSRAEGFIHVKNLPGVWRFDGKTFAIESKETKKRYRIGDTVSIEVMAVNREQATIDYRLLSS